MTHEHLYMVAITPNSKLAQRIDIVRRQFAEKYGFRKALKPPVHITLFEPFRKAQNEITEWMTMLEKCASTQAPFKVVLKNFNYFRNKRSPVLFIDVEKSETMAALWKQIRIKAKKYLNEPGVLETFKPHFTIGYRDIAPEALASIIDDYSNQAFEDYFICNKFYLWRHNGINWQIEHEFCLKGTVPPKQLYLF